MNAHVSAHPALSRFSPLDRVLVYDDFDTGTHGWVELGGNYDGSSNLDTVMEYKRDFRPPQLSACSFFDVGTHGALSGTYALKIATRPEAGHSAVAIRRLTMAGRGQVQFETFFTYKAEAASEDNQAAFQPGATAWDGNTHPSENQFGSFTLGSDFCDGIRYHCVARYLNTDSDHQPRRQWMYPVTPEPTLREQMQGKIDLARLADFPAPNAHDWLPLGGPQEFCYNEVPTKVNWHYLRWLVDTRNRRNVELQVNHRIFDMREVPVPPYSESYGALQSLLNFYVAVRTHTNVRNFLYLDSVLISVDW
jgi:Domain of unknown function (DUF6772)